MESGWPREMSGDAVTLVICRPQVERWEGNRLETGAVLAVKLAGGPAAGSFEVLQRTGVADASAAGGGAER